MRKRRTELICDRLLSRDAVNRLTVSPVTAERTLAVVLYRLVRLVGSPSPTRWLVRRV